MSDVNIVNDAPIVGANKRVYKLRKKNFQSKLVNNMAFLGYAVILIQYLKFGCSVWTLALRYCIQSMLHSPFPSPAQLRRISVTRRSNTATTASTPDTNTGNRNIGNTILSQPLPNIPGFPVQLRVGGSNNDLSNLSDGFAENIESAIEKETKNMRNKIKSIIFYCSLPINILLIIHNMLFPKDFRGLTNGYLPYKKDLNNVPSPFITGNGLIQGERKGGIFLQIIGDFIPLNNLRGNIGNIFYDYIILLCQFGLFILTCINYADEDAEKLSDELDYESITLMDDNGQFLRSNGYDGNVLASQLDPIKTINIMKEESNEADIGEDQEVQSEQYVV